MKKLILTLLMVCLETSLVYAQQESLTLTSYYPSPFGTYDRLRLVPRNGAVNPCDPGTLYVDSNDNGLYICSGGGPSALNVWSQAGALIYPRQGTAPNVGIGTTAPTEKLQVSNGNALFDNNITVGGNTTIGGNASVAGTAVVTGNLGVGTAPSKKLHVAGDAQVDRLFLKADGANEGELKVEYSGGAYYATYAP